MTLAFVVTLCVVATSTSLEVSAFSSHTNTNDDASSSSGTIPKHRTSPRKSPSSSMPLPLPLPLSGPVILIDGRLLEVATGAGAGVGAGVGAGGSATLRRSNANACSSTLGPHCTSFDSSDRSADPAAVAVAEPTSTKPAEGFRAHGRSGGRGGGGGRGRETSAQRRQHTLSTLAGETPSGAPYWLGEAAKHWRRVDGRTSAEKLATVLLNAFDAIVTDFKTHNRPPFNLTRAWHDADVARTDDAPTMKTTATTTKTTRADDGDNEGETVHRRRRRLKVDNNHGGRDRARTTSHSSLADLQKLPQPAPPDVNIRYDSGLYVGQVRYLELPEVLRHRTQQSVAATTNDRDDADRDDTDHDDGKPTIHVRTKRDEQYAGGGGSELNAAKGSAEAAAAAENTRQSSTFPSVNDARNPEEASLSSSSPRPAWSTRSGSGGGDKLDTEANTMATTTTTATTKRRQQLVPHGIGFWMSSDSVEPKVTIGEWCMGQRCGLGVARLGALIDTEQTAKHSKSSKKTVKRGDGGPTTATTSLPPGVESPSLGGGGDGAGGGDGHIGVGTEYAGTWRHDHFEGHGEWSILNRNGDIESYDGDFRMSLRDGQGTYEYNDGSIYTGPWQRDVKFGSDGEFRWLNGDSYVGEWEDNTWHGKGVWVLTPNGAGNGASARYEGEIERGLLEGYGEFEYGDKSVYRGAFHRGKRHGPGEIQFASGDRYNGPWKDDQYDGRGEIVYSDGNTWRGTFAKGQKHGQGILTTSRGLKFSEAYENGVRTSIAPLPLAPSPPLPPRHRRGGAPRDAQGGRRPPIEELPRREKAPTLIKYGSERLRVDREKQSRAAKASMAQRSEKSSPKKSLSPTAGKVKMSVRGGTQATADNDDNEQDDDDKPGHRSKDDSSEKSNRRNNTPVM